MPVPISSRMPTTSAGQSIPYDNHEETEDIDPDLRGWQRV